MFPTGNEAEHLSLVNHTTKTIHLHHHHVSRIFRHVHKVTHIEVYLNWHLDRFKVM